MRPLTRLRVFLRSLLNLRRADSDLEEELQDHLEREIQNNLRAGMSSSEARDAARRLIGSVALHAEECRDSRSTAFFENLLRDLRYAVQTLRRAPLFTAVAVLTLALGIGANTFIFTFVENVLLRSLPVSDPQRLVSLNWGGMVNMSYPNYLIFRERNRVFSDLVAYRANIVNLGLRPRENLLTWGYEAGGNYFHTLGIHPQLGRFFTTADDGAPGAHPVVVLSDRYWRAHFSADPAVIGSTVKLNGFPFTVIGVAPRGFIGTELIMAGDFWVPNSMELEIEPGNDWLHSRGAQDVWTLGRLKPGVTPAQAEAGLDRIAGEITREFPAISDPQARFSLVKPGLIGQALRKPITGFGAVLAALAAIVLLLACVNLAGMLLARASDRHREIGIRLAIGASRFRLVRQLLTESLLLSAAGAALGYALAAAACRLFSAWHPAFDMPFETTLRPDAAVLAFTFAVSLLATLLFGLAPALASIRADIVPSLKDEPPSGRRWRRFPARDFLVAGQIALSVMLVISSALVVRSLQHALTLDLGYRPERAVSLSFDLRLKGYTTEGSRRFAAALLEQASQLPGIEAVGLASNLPLRIDHGNNMVVTRPDRPVPKFADLRSGVIYNISPGYLRAAGTRLLSGRDIEARDRASSPGIALVNQAVVDLLFPHEDPLGRNIRLSTDPADRGLQIVGVVETGKYEYLGEDPHPAVFRPIAQTGLDWGTLVARGPLPPQTAVAVLRKTILDLNPELSLSQVGSLQEQLALPLFPARAAALVLGLFGVLAVSLAATGLFALMAYAVARRTREIGIRMALGARPAQVLSTLFRRTVALCAAGILGGVTITLLAGRVLSAILYGVSPHDPAAYFAALLVMLSVALLACCHPAARAIRTDPARTLREQ